MIEVHSYHYVHTVYISLFVLLRIKSDLDGGNPRVVWDGVELRLIKLLAERNNFSIEIIEPQEPNLG